MANSPSAGVLRVPSPPRVKAIEEVLHAAAVVGARVPSPAEVRDVEQRVERLTGRTVDLSICLRSELLVTAAGMMPLGEQGTGSMTSNAVRAASSPLSDRARHCRHPPRAGRALAASSAWRRESQPMPHLQMLQGHWRDPDHDMS